MSTATPTPTPTPNPTPTLAANTEQNAAAAPASAPAQSPSTTPELSAKAARSQQVRDHVERIRNSERTVWSVVIIVAMLAAFGPVCTDIYLPAVPAITREFHADAATIQLSLTTCFLGLALGQLLIGPLADAYGRKRPLYICLLVFAISSVCCAMTTDVVTLIAARFIQGLSGAGGVVLARTVACDIYTGKRLTQFTALLMTINSLVPILGPILGSGIVMVFDWPALFWFLALWGVLLIFLAFKMFPETLPEDERSSTMGATIGNMLSELTNLRFLFMSLALGTMMGGFVGYLASSPFIFQSIFGLNSMEYACIFGFNAIMLAVVANIAGRIAKIVAEHKIVIVATSAQIFFSVLMALLLVFDIANVYTVGVTLCCYLAIGSAAQTAALAWLWVHVEGVRVPLQVSLVCWVSSLVPLLRL